MRFPIHWASSPKAPESKAAVGAVWDDKTGEWVVDLVTIEDVVVLIKMCGHDLIIDEKSIMIYNDHIE